MCWRPPSISCADNGSVRPARAAPHPSSDRFAASSLWIGYSRGIPRNKCTIYAQYLVRMQHVMGIRVMSVNGAAGAIRTIPASEFRAKCLKLIDEIQESGEEIVITKHGRPAAKLMPHAPKRRAPFGRDRHLVRFIGDVVTPLDVEWEAESNPDRVLNP